jgi:integrase
VLCRQVKVLAYDFLDVWCGGPDKASELLNAPDPETLGGKRDRAILALQIGCGLRRAEILSLEVDEIQQREGRWVIPDLVGKGKRCRTVPVPSWVKVRIEEWVLAADIYKGRLFRPVTKGGKVAGTALSDEKAIWNLVAKYAETTSLGKLSPHDLRRTCAKLCRKAVATSNRFSFSSAMPRS